MLPEGKVRLQVCGRVQLVLLNKSVHSMLGSVVIGYDLKDVRQTEERVLSVTIGHHLER